MSVKTNNIYGKIIITDKTIERFVSHVAMDCYGIVEFSSKNLISAGFKFIPAWSHPIAIFITSP